MSRITEIKKQYPHLTDIHFDLFSSVDPTSSHKYLQFLCNIYTKLSYPNKSDLDQRWVEESTERLNKFGIDTSNMTTYQLLSYNRIFDYMSWDDGDTLAEFIKYMEMDLITHKDVTSYTTINQVKRAISLAKLKEEMKDQSVQIHLEFENDEWLIVRPLTHQSSFKYGSETKWCTTSKHDLSTFVRYWSEGALVYFINKSNGIKFAMYKSIKQNYSNNDISFWTADDNRVDYLCLDIEDSMLPIMKNIISTNITNEELCDQESRDKVRSYPYSSKISDLDGVATIMSESSNNTTGPIGDAGWNGDTSYDNTDPLNYDPYEILETIPVRTVENTFSKKISNFLDKIISFL